MKNYCLSSWKTALVIACTGVALHGGVSAQCTNNLLVRTYDTVISGPGYGTYQFSFPQWTIDSGLLVAVKVRTSVNLQYGYSLKNTDVTEGTYDVLLGRLDRFSSPALTAAYSNTNEQQIGSYNLNPGDQVTQAPIPVNYVSTDSISGNTAPFVGGGTVAFTYKPTTYTSIQMTNTVSYGFHATASELTHFTVSYLYCNGNSVLATGLSSFTARLTEPGTVQLNWSTASEQSDRIYEIQRSGDGRSFSTIGYIKAELSPGAGDLNYSYTDRLNVNGVTVAGTGFGGGDKWYYRLRLVSAGGISYSTIQSVTMPSGGGDKLVVYPNPAVDHINLLVPGDPSSPGDWVVNVRAVDGRLIQTATFFHSNNLPLFFHQTLVPGVYFVQVMDPQGRAGRVASFRVDRR
jgi:hypothetical protein